MFGFGAISELPLSTLPAEVGAVTHTGTATLNASGTVAATPAVTIKGISALSSAAAVSAAGQLTKLGTSSLSSSVAITALPQPLPGHATLSASATLAPVPELTLKAAVLVTGPVTVSADGELTKLGVSSLSVSGTVAAAGELTKLGVASLSSSATIVAHPQPLRISIALSASVTVSGGGALTKFGTATLSASGSTLNVGVVHIGASSLLADTSTLSGKMVGTFALVKGLSSSATVANAPSLNIPVASAISGSGVVSSAGSVEKLGQAHVSTLGSFTSGFTQGFKRGSFVSGRPFLSQNHLDSYTTLVANGVLEKIGSVSMPAVATVTALPGFHKGVSSTLQSIGSLSGNSVLLHGGSVDLNAVVRIQSKSSSDYDNPDIIQMALYIDKLRGVTANIDKTRSIAGYIDKQISIDSKIDLSSGVTSYIDKIVEKTLVRER